MKQILCYGDSNTWGYVPGTGERYARDRRWPGILGDTLGESFHIIEAGLNGRTAAIDDPDGSGCNGLSGLDAVLSGCPPLDMVILMLGTNDLKQHLNPGAASIAQGIARLVERVRAQAVETRRDPPQILLVSPPAIRALAPSTASLFRGGFETSLALPGAIAGVAASLGCRFVDAQACVQVSALDGVHLDSAGHAGLARAIARAVRLAWT